METKDRIFTHYFKELMKITNIPFQKTGFFSKIMHDYLEKNEKLQHFYDNYPDLNGFQHQIEKKTKSFKNESREVLNYVLRKQYLRNINIGKHKKVVKNIELLQKENTFTITTGHQLNLFTGPLYFLYKIISTINLCET